MDIQSFFSANIILQSITVAIFVYVIRLWTEGKWNNLKDNKKFTGVFLPSLSLIVSLLITFFAPIGQIAGQLVGEKIAYALLSGFASSYVFSIFKAFLKKQANLPDSLPPGANNEHE